MKSLVCGCAAAALLAGLAVQAHAEIAVQDAPIHAVPADDEDGAAGPPVAPAQPPALKAPEAKTAEPADIAKAEPAAVKALIAPKVAQQAALTPDENAFFLVLGTRVTDAASAYESYVRRTAAIDPAFSGAASVQKAVKAGAAYQPHQLEEGIVAYAALVALRNPAFVEGVRAMDPRFAEGLAASPERVLQVRGSREAAADVAGVLRAQGEALTAAGKAITKAAYDIQSQSWSKTPVADPQTVLAEAKSSAEAPRTATIPSKEKLLASLVTAPQGQTGIGSGAPDVVRGLALAALAITGHTGDGREAEYEALLHDVSSADCLKMAKMNLNQCLAVAGPQYEDVYCSGRHAVADTGKCVTAAAGAADVADPQEAPPARLETAELGREQAAAYGKATPTVDADDDDAVAAPLAKAQPAQLAAAAQVQDASAEAMPDPRTHAPYQQQPYPAPAPQTYARNDYAPAQPQQPQYNPPQYQPGYQAPQQPQYQQPQYQQSQYPQQAYPQSQYPQQQAYQQPQYRQQPYQQPAYGQQQQYPQQQAYQQQPYSQPQQQTYGYAGQQTQQPYYPQQQQQPQTYYGR